MKILKSAVLGFLAITTLTLCGCSSVKVTTDYDHSVPFGNYYTYAVEPSMDAPALSPTADSALRASLREKLAKRGIREVSANEKPDLAVVPHVKLQQKYSMQQYTTWGYGYGAWPYSGGYYGVWSGAPATYNTIISYTEGTLILDFVDASRQKLVYRGIGSATVSGDTENNAKKIAKAVEKIVAKFPASQPTPLAGNL